MDVIDMNLIITLLIGALAGGLAGQVVKGTGIGLLASIVVGIIGGFIGNWLLTDILKTRIDTGYGFINSVLTSFVGAVALLVVIGFFSGRRKR
ncbi:MAG: GlsB/YeaQ/YmgE family stress response membrane protein [Bacteroidota bacterium]